MGEKKKMPKKGKIMIAVFITLLLVLSGVTIKLFNSDKNHQVEKETTNTDKVEVKEEKKEEQKEKTESEQEEIPSEIDTPKEDTSSVSTNNNVSNNTNSSNKQTNTPSVNNNNTVSPPVVKEEPKKVEVWEQLGISEYDYYNTPANGWSVDVPVKDCGNRENCVTVCQEKANAYLESFKSGRYRCTSLNSHSRAYLGEHISYFDLES